MVGLKQIVDRGVIDRVERERSGVVVCCGEGRCGDGIGVLGAGAEWAGSEDTFLGLSRMPFTMLIALAQLMMDPISLKLRS